jgi:hypothetical protein
MRLMTIILLVFSAIVLSSSAEADDAAKRSPELQVLDNFVGTWDVKVTVKPAEQEAVTFEGVSHRKWSRGGKFVLFDDPGQEEELHLPITYDPKSRTYPGVIINGVNGENTGVVTGTWDEDTKTMHFLIGNTNKTKYRGTHRFIRRDYAEASGKVTNADGDVLVELSFKQTRRKE